MADQSCSDEQPRSLRFLSVQQAADELNTTEALVRALIKSGALRAIQIGGRGQWRIERTELEDYITAAYAKARTGIAPAGGDGDADARLSSEVSG